MKLFCRLQTGMRGAFGKPQGTVARVRIGQPIMSVRTSDRHRAAVVEALRRAKFKFPGRQKVRHVNFCFKSETSRKPYCMPAHA
jgi:ribosomal protein L16/L10AE